MEVCITSSKVRSMIHPSVLGAAYCFLLANAVHRHLIAVSYTHLGGKLFLQLGFTGIQAIQLIVGFDVVLQVVSLLVKQLTEPCLLYTSRWG